MGAVLKQQKYFLIQLTLKWVDILWYCIADELKNKNVNFIQFQLWVKNIPIKYLFLLQICLIQGKTGITQINIDVIITFFLKALQYFYKNRGG